MKPTTSLVVLSGLVSLTTADALPPEDVPVQCATICGPIVELSSKCTPAKSSSNKVGDSTNQTSNPWIGRRQDGTKYDEESNNVGLDDDGELDRRFFTIVPAPTSFAAKYSSVLNPGGDTLSLQQESLPTRITPVIVKSSNPPPPPPPVAPAIPSSSQLPPPPPAPSVPSPSKPLPPTSQLTIPNNANPTPTQAQTKTTSSLGPDKVQSTMSLMENTGAIDGTSLDSEERCVCLNKSFDVPRVAALCTSCIVQNGFPQTNMHVVMSVCGFSELNYTPRDDSLVDNIRVSATRPTVVWGHNAGVSNGGGTHRVGVGGRGGIGIGLCVFIWAALFDL